jgi:hypothetical protein
MRRANVADEMKTWEMHKKSTHKKVKISTPFGEKDGIAPLVISASRATDIPAYHAEWFMHRLNQGYCVWMNPFNRKKMFISFSNCKVIVFWSKNPKPLIPYLDEIFEKGIECYFQYTINDYEKEGFEPNVPELDDRIKTFIGLSKKISKERVIWRYDPIMPTNELSLDEILGRIKRIGEKINPYTAKLVFSFVDILNYSRVKRNLKNTGAKEPSLDEQSEFAQKLSELNSMWKLQLAVCAENEKLPGGIFANKCIDGELICKICPDDIEIKAEYGSSAQPRLPFDNVFVTPAVQKDKGQREKCGCALSKDIGSYNTCPHLCAYCYANHSETAVMNNQKRLSVESESL